MKTDTNETHARRLRPVRALRTLTATFALLIGAGAVTGQAAAQPPAASSPAAEARADIQRTLGFGPQFLLRLPDAVLPSAWDELKGLQINPNTALSGKTKELVGLGVAAQIPCRYCIISHTEFARLNGASEAEVGEALAMAALTRHWSTYINGIQLDEAQFRSDINRLVETAKKAAASKTPMPAPGRLTDGASALAEIQKMFGFVPEHIRRFPDTGRAGAWRQVRDVQLNPRTALSGKDKELVGLAVAAQVPCKFCVIAHTEFARLNGATDAEINEALGMAAITRNMSTLLNGMLLDEGQFRRDIDRLVKNARAAAKTPTRATAPARPGSL